MSDYLDKDGYPTDEALKLITEWEIGNDHEKAKNLMAFIHEIWWHPVWGFEFEFYHSGDTNVQNRYRLHTGGWSGNESIIQALQENHLFWMIYWYSSRRGGHYEFRIPPYSHDGDD